MKGIIANLLTPLKDLDALCDESMHSLLNYLYKNNVKNYFILGSAGEDFSLPFSTKQQVFRFFDRNSLEGENFILGLSCPSMVENDLLLSQLEEFKSISAFHFICYDQKIGDKQYVQQVKYLSETCPKPLYLYHNPKRGKPLNVDTLKEIINFDNIGGIKIGGYSKEEFLEFKSICPSTWNLFCAGAGQIVDCLNLGFKSHSTSDANIFPLMYDKIFKLFNDGDNIGAIQHQNIAAFLEKMVPNTTIFNGQRSAEEKLILTHLDILKSEQVNGNYRELDDEQKKLAISAFEIYSKIYLQ